MLVLAALFSCIEPILAIAACLSYKDPFYTLIEKRKREHAAQKKYELGGDQFSDLLIYSNVFKRFQEEKSNNQQALCEKYSLSYHRLKSLLKLQDEFALCLYNMNLLDNADKDDSLANKNSKNMSLLRAILCTGLYPNIAIISGRKVIRNNTNIIETNQGRTSFSSLNSKRTNFPSPYLIYFSRQVNSNGSTYLNDTTCVSSIALLFAAPTALAFREILSTLNIQSNDITEMLQELFIKFDNLLHTKICQPSFKSWNTASEFLQVIIQLLSEYDEYLGFDSCRNII